MAGTATAIAPEPTTTPTSTGGRARGGGFFPPGGGGRGGGGGKFPFDPNWGEFNGAPRLTQAEYDRQKEIGFQIKNGLEMVLLQEKCRGLVQDIKKEQLRTDRKKVEVQTAEVEVKTAKVGLSIAKEKLGEQQARLTTAGHRRGMAEDEATIAGSERNLQWGIGAQRLRSLSFDLTEAASKNDHRGEMLELQGWTNYSLPAGTQPRQPGSGFRLPSFNPRNILPPFRR